MFVEAMLAAVLAAQDGPCDDCRRLKENDMFSPVVPPPAPQPVAVAPSAPPPPRRRPLSVAGLILDTPSQTRYVLLYDAQWEQGVYLKTGDRYDDIEVLEVTDTAARLKVGEEEHTLGLGESMEILDRGRPDGSVGRIAPPAPTGTPSSSPGVRPSNAGSPARNLIEEMRERFRNRGRRQP